MEQTNLFIALGGLLIFTLMLASIVRQYQERMAEKRMRIQRIVRGVDQIVDLLQRVVGCPLPAEIEKLLREDILSRYRAVRQIDRRFLGIEELISAAEQAVGLVREGQNFDIQDKPQLLKITNAMGEMIGFLQIGMLLRPMTQAKIRAFIELLGTRRSECVYRFHLAKAKEMQEQDQLHGALGHCNSIKTFLTEHGPANNQAKAWFAEAEELRKSLLSKASDLSTPAT